MNTFAYLFIVCTNSKWVLVCRWIQVAVHRRLRFLLKNEIPNYPMRYLNAILQVIFSRRGWCPSLKDSNATTRTQSYLNEFPQIDYQDHFCIESRNCKKGLALNFLHKFYELFLLFFRTQPKNLQFLSHPNSSATVLPSHTKLKWYLTCLLKLIPFDMNRKSLNQMIHFILLS